MKIVSKDIRIIDELAQYLDNKDIDFKKIQLDSKRDNNAPRPMGGMETWLSMGADITTILTGVALVIGYINHNYPEWYVVFLPKKDEIPMTTKEYEKMSDNAKRALLEHYDIRIKKK
jgi:hypothetical protein